MFPIWFFFCVIHWFIFIFIFFCSFLSVECMMYPVLILAYEVAFTEPSGCLHNSETEINFFEESWAKTVWVAVSVNCFRSAMTRSLDSPLISQNVSKMSMWQANPVLEEEASTWQRESEVAELECKKGERKVCPSQVVYTVFFNYRFWNGMHVTGILKTQVTKILVHINLYEPKLKCEN